MLRTNATASRIGVFATAFALAAAVAAQSPAAGRPETDGPGNRDRVEALACTTSNGFIHNRTNVSCRKAKRVVRKQRTLRRWFCDYEGEDARGRVVTGCYFPSPAPGQFPKNVRKSFGYTRY